MNDNIYADEYLAKAFESLLGAESEAVNGRFNNSANRSYYACFQAAIAALVDEGGQPSRADARWGHDFVQARFAGRLINRRKMYPAELRGTLVRNYLLREAADYKRDLVSRTQADRAFRRAREFVTAVGRRRGDGG